MQIKTFLLLLLLCNSNATHPFTIMLNPTGYARHYGRIIDGCYERGIALQLAEQLQKTLQEQYPSLRVLLAGGPGKRLEPLQQAHIANRLQVDLYITLFICPQKESKPHLAVYTYAAHPADHLKTSHTQTLQFLPFDQAHIAGHSKAVYWAKQILKRLQEKQFFTAPSDEIFSIPLIGLAGIQAPQIGIEVSMLNATDVNNYAPLLADAIATIFSTEAHFGVQND